ncbi:MAG TPA: hypothetical protein PL131_08400 [Methylotenera sp.]|nr:hypothetical protein [Methylotenera sp.]HPH05879.1 hypothetical protein [Methylotenera sp.]HPN00661.1 hypothetical protein [Methylotenera sp.]
MSDTFFKKSLPYALGFLFFIYSMYLMMVAASINAPSAHLKTLYSGTVWVICIVLSLAIVIYQTITNSKNNWVLAFIFVLVSIPMIYQSYPILMNCYFDTSESIYVEASVIEKTVSEYKNSKGRGYSYSAELNLDKAYSEFKHFKLSKAEYNRLKVNSKLTLEIKNGGLGYKWVKSYEIVNLPK